jgi:hypothetical protein
VLVEPATLPRMLPTSGGGMVERMTLSGFTELWHRKKDIYLGHYIYPINPQNTTTSVKYIASESEKSGILFTFIKIYV